MHRLLNSRLRVISMPGFQLLQSLQLATKHTHGKVSSPVHLSFSMRLDLYAHRTAFFYLNLMLFFLNSLWHL